jgi:single-strand DNA-binding protein
MRDINSLNKVILVGRLGAKPEIRSHAQSGRSSARFTLATNERLYNPSTQTSTDKTEWHKIVVWFPRLVEFSEKYLDKGKQILVEGSIRTREYQDRDGNRRFITEIVADKIVFLGRREESSATRTDTTDLDEVYSQGGSRGGGGGEGDEFPSGEESGSSGSSDDDIPF